MQSQQGSLSGAEHSEGVQRGAGQIKEEIRAALFFLILGCRFSLWPVH